MPTAKRYRRPPGAWPDAGGDPAEAGRLLAGARRADPAADTSLHGAAAAALLLLDKDGDIGTAHRLLVDAIESGGHGYDASDSALVEALFTLITVCWYGGGPAHSFHRAQAVVHGPPERAFGVITDVARWTDWVPECEEVATDVFEKTFGVLWAGYWFEVFVGENVAPHRLGWLGIGAGVQLYQAWLFTEVENGTDIVVENAVRTAAPKSRDTLSHLWAERLDWLWRAQLAELSENPPG